jgi:flagellin
VAKTVGEGTAPITTADFTGTGAATVTSVSLYDAGADAVPEAQALDLSDTTVVAGGTMDFEIDGTTVTYTNSGLTDLKGADLADAIETSFGATKAVGTEVYAFAQSGTTATLNITQAAGSEAPIDLITSLTSTASIVGTYTFSLDEGTAVNVTATAGSVVTATEIAAAIGGVTGFDAVVNDEGKVEITKLDGTSFTFAESIDVNGDGTLETATTAGFADINDTPTTFKGQISLNSTTEIVLTGTGLADAGLASAGNASTTIDLVDISTRDGAIKAISSVDAALGQIDAMRGDLGAVQNRFESTISNLSNVSENLSAARSRILDADIAQETSAMTKNNILQQAGVAILAQANQAPQLALSLLK